MEAAGFAAGCPVGGVVLDLAGADDALRSVCAEIVKRWEASMADSLTEQERAGRATQFH